MPWYLCEVLSYAIEVTDALVTMSFARVRVTFTCSSPPGDIYEPVAVYVPSLYVEEVTAVGFCTIAGGGTAGDATGVWVGAGELCVGVCVESATLGTGAEEVADEDIISYANVTLATPTMTTEAMAIPNFFCNGLFCSTIVMVIIE